MIVARSPNHDSRRGRRVDTLVLHYTGMRSAAAAWRRLADPRSRVSAHYLITEDGAVLAMVPETRRAWHAGVAAWRGATDINARSIGIELVNPGHAFGYRRFPEPQMAALIKLARAIVSRHRIAARDVVGHADVAPRRKRDPGELFDWRRLAGAGIGRWPRPPWPEASTDVAADLAAIGYDVTDARAALIAFQRRFRPQRVDGVADPDTRRRLAAMRRLACGRPAP